RRAPNGHGDPDPGDHQRDECGHAPPALATDVSRHQNVTVSTRIALSVTGGIADVTVDGASGPRRRPISASASSTQAASSRKTTSGTKGNRESERVAPPLALTAYCAAQPKAGC